MTPLGFVENATLSPPAFPETTPGLQLTIEDTLASADRLWLRGRLLGALPPAGNGRGSDRWWLPWGKKAGAADPAPTAHLEVRVAGSVIAADLPLRADGRFDVILPAVLPHARRGWRVARYRATYQAKTVEGCGLILSPRAKLRGGVVVVLPLGCTMAADAARRLGRSDLVGRLTPVLQRLHQSAPESRPIYYLAAVPAEGRIQPAELALTATTLGWPGGHFVLLPADSGRGTEPLLHGLDRLRWLFAGDLDLQVINLEATLARILPARLEPAEDRAVVRRLTNADDDPWGAVDDERPAALRPRPPTLRFLRSGPVPRHPIVFCHGMLAYSMLRMQIPEDHNCFTVLRKFLQERGCRVFFPHVAPTGSVAERAAQMREQIRRWTDEPVNLVAHSMGGLDCRYLISRLGMADRVRSLTTVGTPHRGTYLADWFLANYRNRVPLLLALEAVGVSFEGFRDCRPGACAALNKLAPDAPGVRYFSYAGDVPQSKVTPVLRRAWTILTAAEGPNDAMVSVKSARWGEFLGTVSADHFAQTPDGLFVREGETFDSLAFFARIVEHLARRGF
jgi:triacylglycerol lipase